MEPVEGTEDDGMVRMRHTVPGAENGNVPEVATAESQCSTTMPLAVFLGPVGGERDCVEEPVRRTRERWGRNARRLQLGPCYAVALARAIEKRGGGILDGMFEMFFRARLYFPLWTTRRPPRSRCPPGKTVPGAWSLEPSCRVGTRFVGS